MENERASAEGVDVRPPSPSGTEGPPTPHREPELVPMREESFESRLSWYEQDQNQREAERVTADILVNVLFIAAERVEAIEAERYELFMMREQAVKAAMRRLYDPVVVHDEPRIEMPSDTEGE